MTLTTIYAADGCDIRQMTPTTNYDGGLGDVSPPEHWHQCGMETKTQEISPLHTFDFTSIDSGDTISLAELKIYITAINSAVVGLPENFTFTIYKCLRDWVTDEATWNIYSTGNSWTTAGAKGNGSDRDATKIKTYTGPSGTGWFTIDVTALVQDAHADDQILNIINCGYLLLVDYGAYCWYMYTSYTADSNKPKLEITHTGGETHEASASLTGSGALAATGRLFLGGAASLAGSGALAVAAKPTLVGSSSLTGEGAMSAAASPTLVGVASLVGEGALSVASVATLKGMASLSGEGSLTAAAKPTLTGVASLAGAGSISVVASPILTGIISMSGEGSLSISALNYCLASASLAGEGTLAAVAKCYVPGSVSMSGEGTLGATGRLTLVGVVSLAGEGLLSVLAKPILVGVVSMSGEGTVAPILIGVVVGSVSMSGEGTLRVDAWIVKAAVVPVGHAAAPTGIFAEAVSEGPGALAHARGDLLLPGHATGTITPGMHARGEARPTAQASGEVMPAAGTRATVVPSARAKAEPVPSGAASLGEVGATDWLTPTAIYDKCGEEEDSPATNAIDEDTGTYWQHNTVGYHWIAVDLGATKIVTRVRQYVYGIPWGFYEDIDVYVSDDPESWGDAVWTGDLSGDPFNPGWDESGPFVKAGRYVKLQSGSNSQKQRMYELGIGVPGAGLSRGLSPGSARAAVSPEGSAKTPDSKQGHSQVPAL